MPKRVHIVKNVNALDNRSVTYDVNTTLSNRIASTCKYVLGSSSLDLKPVEQRIAYFDDKLPPLFCVKAMNYNMSCRYNPLRLCIRAEEQLHIPSVHAAVFQGRK